MATEANMEIYTVNKGDKTYKNLVLKPTKKQRAQGIEGLKPDQYIIVEKLMPDGYELTSTFNGREVHSYSCKAKYGDEEVSFFLSESQHDVYKELGGEGAKVKITGKLVQNKKTGAYYVDFDITPVIPGE